MSFTRVHCIGVVLSTTPCSFLGTASEPRPSLSSGHIPHALSLPFKAFLNDHTAPNSGVRYSTFLSIPELRQALVGAIGDEQAKLVIAGKRPIVTSCGSGMTASILWLGLRMLGTSRVALYDEVRILEPDCSLKLIRTCSLGLGMQVARNPR